MHATARPHVNPQAYLRIAFDALAWTGWTYEAAMHDATRRRIVEFIANHYPRKMETIVPIARIEQLAHQAATHHPHAADALPYPSTSAAGKLFVLFFETEQKRRQDLAQRAHLAMKEITGIEHEAVLAAAVPEFRDVNDACPYPFNSFKGAAFRAAFLQKRCSMSLETSE